MTETLANECEITLAFHSVDEDFMSFRAEREKLATRAHFDCRYFVRVWYLCHRGLLVTVPEEDRGPMAGRHQFKFTVRPLGHAKMGAICRLPPIDAFFLFKVVCANRPVLRAAVDYIDLVGVWEQSHDVLLLVY